MALFSIPEVRNVQIPFNKSANILLTEGTKPSPTSEYDIFLSHSFKDADLISKLKIMLEKYGYSVYVDWIEDPELNREFVTKYTANVLKLRMKYCKCLLYAVTGNSPNSKWMPWELGFFDGKKPRKVAILPLQQDGGRTNTYQGQEYLGIYPYITRDKTQSGTEEILWVNESEQNYVGFYKWLNEGAQPSLHA